MNLLAWSLNLHTRGWTVKMKITLLALALAMMGACTWVELEPSGSRVRVAAMSESLSGCKYKGEITTTVTNRVVGIERNSIKVADELETMARNEAAGLSANVVQAKGEAVAGEQRFVAYACP